MKIVDAFWEIRNLGKKTLEITLESEDFNKTPDEIYFAIENLRNEYKAEYLVVKIRTGRPEFGNELCRHDFIHIETQLNLKAYAEDVEFALKKYSRFFRDTELVEAKNSEDLNYIKSEIMKGIFYTDRIALDKNFGVEIANKRYANWVEDEFNRDSKLFFIMFKENNIGFALRRYEKNQVHALIAGLFSKYKDSRIGGTIYSVGLTHDLEKGFRIWYTDVSSNNSSSLRLQQQFGYKVYEIQDVYIKHFTY